MNFTDLASMRAGLADKPAAYNEFLRVPALSAGLYRLQAGAVDPQQPHREDEIYFIISGRGSIQVGGAVHPVVPGDCVYVPKSLDHRFLGITEELEILVVFAPAESS